MTRTCRWLLYGMLASLLLAPRSATANDLTDQQMADALIALHNFAEKHALSDAQMRTLIGEFAFNEQYFGKGGAGIIGENSYVLLRTDRNTLRLPGGEWQGKPYQEPEIVVTDGRRVISSVDGVDVAKLKIVIFSPGEVRIIDLSNYSGGRYLRNPPQ